jgi:hypothetical protein
VAAGSAVTILHLMGFERITPAQAAILDPYFACAVQSARQVAGDAWSRVVETAGLAELLAGFRPEKKGSRTAPVDALSKLTEAFELVFAGDAPNRLRQWGRLTTDSWLHRTRAARRRRRALRLMPGRQRKLALLLKLHMDLMDAVRGERLQTWKQIDDRQFWLVHFGNLCALGRRKRERACHFWVASLEALLRWAGLANHWVVEEIECGCVTGTHDCVFALRAQLD